VNHASRYNVDLNAPQKSAPQKSKQMPLIVHLLVTVTEPKKFRQWSKGVPKSLHKELRINP
jgi:hypothetical protein